MPHFRWSSSYNINIYKNKLYTYIHISILFFLFKNHWWIIRNDHYNAFNLASCSQTNRYFRIQNTFKFFCHFFIHSYLHTYILLENQHHLWFATKARSWWWSSPSLLLWEMYVAVNFLLFISNKIRLGEGEAKERKFSFHAHNK